VENADEIRKVIPDLELPHLPRNPSTAVSGFLTSLMSSAPPASPDLQDLAAGENAGSAGTSTHVMGGSPDPVGRIVSSAAAGRDDDATMN
jgi:hypothetical protein